MNFEGPFQPFYNSVILKFSIFCGAFVLSLLCSTPTFIQYLCNVALKSLKVNFCLHYRPLTSCHIESQELEINVESDARSFSSKYLFSIFFNLLSKFPTATSWYCQWLRKLSVCIQMRLNRGKY